MNSELITKIAEIIGVSEDSITALPEEIVGSMQAAAETFSVTNDEERKALYGELDKLWTKGSVLLTLKEIADNTGIAYSTLCGLKEDVQHELVYEYMTDSGNTDRIYAITNNALALMELEKVSRLLDVPVSKLRTLPIDMQEHICGMYSMEYEENGGNFELITHLREVLGL